jgi:hypothetical protein
LSALLLLSLAGIAGFLAPACAASGSEQQMVAHFFRASRILDTVALSDISFVTFQPSVDGSVQDFTVTRVDADRWQRVRGRELSSGQAAPQTTRLVVESLTMPGAAAVDPSALDVDVATKQVTVTAEVRTPSGLVAPKTIVFTFQRAIGRRPGQNDLAGRWLITGFR